MLIYQYIIKSLILIILHLFGTKYIQTYIYIIQQMYKIIYNNIRR